MKVYRNTLFFIFLITSIFFSGCTFEKNSKQTLNSNRKILIGLDDSLPPMTFRKKDNSLQGFDIDLAKALGKKLNVEIEFVPVDWDAVILSLNCKRFDIIMSALTVTNERKKSISFSNPYINQNQVVVIKRNNSNIKTVKDLNNKNIGVQMGSSSEEAVLPLENNIKSLKKYNKNTEALQDLLIGRTDAVVIDELVARYYLKENSKDFLILKESLAKEPIALGFRKNDTKLQEQFNKALDALKKDGTIAKISSKWFAINLID